MAHSLGFGARKQCALLVTIAGSLMALQLIACSEQAGAGNEPASAQVAPGKPTAASKWAYPILVVKGEQAGGLSTKQSKAGSDKKQPDFVLVFLEPYEQFIPKQVMDMIDENVRPLTENWSSQVISTVPGAEEAWAQMSGVMNSLQNMGGLQSILGGASGGNGGGNPLSGLMENFGRRR